MRQQELGEGPQHAAVRLHKMRFGRVPVCEETPMTSVLLAAPDDGATNTWIASALARAGCEGATYDYRAAAEQNGIDAMQHELFELGKKHDVVLAMKGEIIHLNTWNRLRQAGRHTAIWMPDAWFHSEPWVMEAARAVDTYFTTSLGLAKKHRVNGANACWLPEGCDQDDHAPDQPNAMEPVMPISFTGTIENIPAREQLMVKLRERFGPAFHVFGSHPGKLVGRNHHGRAEEYYGNGNRSISSVAARTLINLDHQRNPELEQTYGARIWRTLCAGGFLLTNNIAGIQKDFGPNGTSLAWYRDADDCAKLVEKYLDDRTSRARVAETGRRLVLEHHTFDHRIRELLKVIGFPMDRPLTAAGLVERGP